jgi:hypothetical protein
MIASKTLALAFAAAIAAAGPAWADSTREMAPPPAPAPARPVVQIVKAEPRNADALNLMGYSLRKTGQTDLALPTTPRWG